MKCFASILVMLTPAAAMSHGGGLNAEGCHNNRKTGDYHCHRAPASVPKKEQPSNLQRPFSDPTCHVGPRGGTYTITPSGKKNYNGC